MRASLWCSALLLTAAIVCGAGCSPDNGTESSAAGGQSAGGAGGGASISSSSSSMGGSPEVGSVTGTVLDTDGMPIVDAPIQLCADVCYLGFTDSSGDFGYGSVPAGHYKVDVRGPTDTPIRYGAINFPIDLAADQQLAIEGPLYLPATGDGTALTGGEQQVAIDAQLSLTIDLANLQFPLGAEGGYLAGVRVAPEHAPPNMLPSGEALAWWVLNPFGTLSSAPIALTISDSLGVAAGAQVAIYSISDQSGEMTFEGHAQVAADGSHITLDGAQGLSQISWLVVATPQR